MMKILLERRVLAVSMAVAVVFLGFIAWRVYLLKQASSDVKEQSVLQFGYCGAELEELCLLSFGRDSNGHAIINLFVPDRDLPDFYLNISRFNGESIYVCMKNGQIPTNVLCMGDVINLNERVEIDIMSSEDYRVLARGTFNLTAILISTEAWDFQIPQTNTLVAASPTQSSIPDTSAASTPTSTPSISYPNYP